jgi:hypothetical protein
MIDGSGLPNIGVFFAPLWAVQPGLSGAHPSMEGLGLGNGRDGHSHAGDSNG